ncbi:nucleoside monophosphate kinase [Candidatus Saccharibacteria bacterium]|nr:nucleoside monophosphate kinase [Candidatus Saccharibacteria bacterium]
MIIFVGVAGSGKSVQGRKLADRFGLPWLSTGEFLRMLVSGERRKAMLQGELLGDQEIIALVQKIFSVVDSSQEFVLDGFPRTTAQADWLLNQAKHEQLHITAVVHMVASEKAVEKRLLGRGRADDTPEVIQHRFKEYQETVIPLLAQFREAKIPVLDIEAEGEVEEIHDSIVIGVEPLLRS